MDDRTDEPPEQDETARQRAELLLGLSRHSDALAIATRLVASRPQDPRIWALLSRCQLASGAHPQALVSMRQALALAPDHPPSMVWASKVLSAVGRRDLAMQMAEEAVRLAPDLVAAHAAVAVLAADSAPRGTAWSWDDFLWKQARWHAQTALRLDPADPDAVFVAAYVELRAGQYARARRGFRAVLAVDPTHAAAQNNLAVLEMQRLRLTRAGNAFAGLVAAEPSNRRVLRNVGRVAIRQVAAEHGIFWLLYACSVVWAATAPAAPSTWSWTWSWRGLVVVLAFAGLVGGIARRWRRAGPGVRFVRGQLLAPWQWRTIVSCDLVLVSLLLISAGSSGSLAWMVAAIGVVLTVPTIAILVRGRAADRR